MRTLFFVVVALIFAVPATAQQRTVVTVAEPPTTFYNVGKAEVSYFAGSNSTEVRIDLSRQHSGGHSAYLWFVSTFAGKDIVIPKEVFVGLGFRSDKSRLEKLEGFVIEADEMSLKLVNRTVKGITFELDKYEWARAVVASLPFAEFQKLVASKSVRVQVADVSFDLDQISRGALRDMLKAITEPTKKS